jgi:hypothetical protein
MGITDLPHPSRHDHMFNEQIRTIMPLTPPHTQNHDLLRETALMEDQRPACGGTPVPLVGPVPPPPTHVTIPLSLRDGGPVALVHRPPPRQQHPMPRCPYNPVQPPSPYPTHHGFLPATYLPPPYLPQMYHQPRVAAPRSFLPPIPSYLLPQPRSFLQSRRNSSQWTSHHQHPRSSTSQPSNAINSSPSSHPTDNSSPPATPPSSSPSNQHLNSSHNKSSSSSSPKTNSPSSPHSSTNPTHSSRPPS